MRTRSRDTIPFQYSFHVVPNDGTQMTTETRPHETSTCTLETAIRARKSPVAFLETLGLQDTVIGDCRSEIRD